MTNALHADITRHLHGIDQKLEQLRDEWIAAKSLPANDPANSALLDVFNDVKAEITGKLKEFDFRYQQDIIKMRDDINALREQQVGLIQNGQLFSMVPASPFIQRLYQEHYYEKWHVGKFAAQRFFGELKWGSRCFVQSSTIAHYLMMHVDSNPSIDGSCLIYTNSAVAPIPLLFGRTMSRHSIWPFRGHLFDNACGGWLLPTNDQLAIDALRELFRRKDWPLDTVFITPRYITPSDGFFFEREEAAFLATVLATEAKNVVILCLGDRVKASRQELPNGSPAFPALERVLAESREKITAVISWPQQEVLPICTQIKNAVGKLHWQSCRGWEEL